LDYRFLYYNLLHIGNTKGFDQYFTGATIKHLPGEKLAKVEVFVPPLAEQKCIAGILSAYDELIENSQRRIRVLETMARNLYREWFVHFRYPGHENTPLIPSPLGDIPKGWEVNTVESLISEHIGGGWGQESPDDVYSDPAWVIRGTDIPAARCSQIEKIPYRYHKPSNLRSRKLKPSDILFEVSGGSKGQPVGRSLLVTSELISTFNGDVICASFCKRIQPDAQRYGSEMLYLSFLEGYESGEIEQFQVQSTGITNFKWTEYIAQTKRVIPPALLRARVRDQVLPLFSKISLLGNQIQNLRKTRDLLLPRLLSGQIPLHTPATQAA
jgi:type I restriction enzyme S subunit